MEAITRADLERWQRRDEFAVVRAGWEAAPEVTVQVSGGSSGAPLLWARSQADLEDIYRRVARQAAKVTGSARSRVALVGGVSHTRAALNWRMAAVEVRSFEAGETAELETYDADLISCYPSLARELFLGASPLAARSLRALKLGGERVFRSDVARLHAALPDVPVIEQYGSTELPAMAFRCHVGGVFNRVFEFEADRFEVTIDPETSGWQPVVARDRFPDLIVPLLGFYANGDEALVEDGNVVDLRRCGDAGAPFWELAEELYGRGVVNLQIVPSGRLVRCVGGAALPTSLACEGVEYRIVPVRSLARTEGSHKLPLVLPSAGT